MLQILNVQNQTSDCHEPCNAIHYSASIATAQYPATYAYFKSYLDRSNQAAKTPWIYSNYTTLEEARENMLYLRIFFEDLKTESEVQTASYNFGSFVAEVGGMLDLFIGFSFFTVIQLVEILYGLGVSWRRGRKHGPEGELKSPSSSSSDGVVSRVTGIFK